MSLYFAEGTKPIPAGKHQLRMVFEYDGAGQAKGGTVSLSVDGRKDGEGRIDMTCCACSRSSSAESSACRSEWMENAVKVMIQF